MIRPPPRSTPFPTRRSSDLEHTFVHQIKELLDGIGNKQKVTPDFYDGLRCQQVLDAVLISTSRNTWRSEEHTSELQSQSNLVCRLLLEKKKKKINDKK